MLWQTMAYADPNNETCSVERTDRGGPDDWEWPPEPEEPIEVLVPPPLPNIIWPRLPPHHPYHLPPGYHYPDNLPPDHPGRDQVPDEYSGS